MDPRHFRKGKLQASIIHRKELAKGELSVWRIPDSSEASATALVEKLEPGANAHEQTVRQLLAVPAAQVRDIVENGRRLISVIDDTRIDDAGGFDPQHAAISPCMNLLAAVRDPDDGTLEDLHNKLLMTYRQAVIWQRAA